MSFFLGLLFGFISAIPVAGPVSAVIFGLAMKGRYSQARWLAFGAGVVESLYAYLAFWSFQNFLVDLSFIFTLSNIVAALLLSALGVYFFRSKKMRHPVISSSAVNTHNIKSFFAGAGMSLVNPTLIATWTAAITTFYSMKLFVFSTSNSIIFSIGICGGIFIWFSCLISLMVKHRNNFSPTKLDKTFKLIGIGLFTLALWIVYRSLR